MEILQEKLWKHGIISGASSILNVIYPFLNIVSPISLKILFPKYVLMAPFPLLPPAHLGFMPSVYLAWVVALAST